MSEIKKISTTALAKNLSVSKHELDEILLKIEYVSKMDDGFDLTELGKSFGVMSRKLWLMWLQMKPMTALQ